MKRKPVVIDLFCGAGGLSEGFRQAGYRIAGGVDIDKDAIETFRVNFPEAVIINKDIREISSKELLEMCSIEEGQLDVIIGGPPCQGFSHAGKRLVDDPRNVLFKEFVRMVNELRPTAFLMENVVGLVTMADGRFKDEILTIFREIGYEVDVKIINTAEYGVPQVRRRTIFLGNKIGKKVTFPLATHSLKPQAGLLNCVNSGEALEDLPPLGIDSGDECMQCFSLAETPFQSYMRGNITYDQWLNDMFIQKQEDYGRMLYNHWTTSSKPETREKFIHIPPGENWRALPEHLKTKGKYSNLYRRLNPDAPCVTLTNIRKSMFIHPWEDRLLTVREGARIQGFPDYIRFMGNLNSQQQQIGNAVPPILGCVFGLHIIKEYLS